eukprot:12409682-Karenia_brevis.AAC.1
MGDPPPSNVTFSKVAKCVPPMVYWSGAQHYLNGMGFSTKLAIIDHDHHQPVGVSHVMKWMVDYGKAVLEHRKHGPPLATGRKKWEEQN